MNPHTDSPALACLREAITDPLRRIESMNWRLVTRNGERDFSLRSIFRAGTTTALPAPPAATGATSAFALSEDAAIKMDALVCVLNLFWTRRTIETDEPLHRVRRFDLDLLARAYDRLGQLQRALAACERHLSPVMLDRLCWDLVKQFAMSHGIEVALMLVRRVERSAKGESYPDLSKWLDELKQRRLIEDHEYTRLQCALGV